MVDLFNLFLLILASAVFAMSEIAMAAARKIKLMVMVEEGNSKAAEILALQEDPGAFFAMVQIGLNAIAILGGILGEAALTPYVRDMLVMVYSGALLDQISFFISFFIITALFILFADLLPKRLAMIMPESIAIRVITPMRWVTLALTPLVMFFNGITNGVLRLLRLPTEQKEVVTTEDIVATIGAGLDSGSVQPQELQIIENVFELEQRTLSSAMVPRDSIVYFDLADDSAHISQVIIDHPHNTFLVCDGSLDKLIGLVDSKEILRKVLKGEPAAISAEEINQNVFYLPETLSMADALNAFRIEPQQLAVVVNEYALIVGVVTVKDLLGGFMGELITPAGKEQIVQRDDQSWIMDGLTPIVDVMRYLGLEEFPDKNQYDTIAGFIIYQLRKLPKLTDHVNHAGYKFEVIDLEGVRITQVLVTRLPPAD
ncbi:MAG: hemolysin family protein [Pseudomonadota bacterium]|nr:hemolysin family protein [Pseudomonadota bacterium]